MNLYRGRVNQSSTSTTTKNQRPSSLNNSQMYESQPLKSPLNFNETGTDLLKHVGKWLSVNYFIGPGEYEFPDLIGTKHMLSKMRNIPAFSISSRHDQNRKLIISKNHKVEQIGRDSPGVGQYKYDYADMQKKVLANGNGGNNYSFGFGTRFFDFRQST